MTTACLVVGCSSEDGLRPTDAGATTPDAQLDSGALDPIQRAREDRRLADVLPVCASSLPSFYGCIDLMSDAVDPFDTWSPGPVIVSSVQTTNLDRAFCDAQTEPVPSLFVSIDVTDSVNRIWRIQIDAPGLEVTLRAGDEVEVSRYENLSCECSDSFGGFRIDRGGSLLALVAQRDAHRHWVVAPDDRSELGRFDLEIGDPICVLSKGGDCDRAVFATILHTGSEAFALDPFEPSMVDDFTVVAAAFETQFPCDLEFIRYDGLSVTAVRK